MLSQVFLQSPAALPVAVSIAVLALVVVCWLYPVQVRASAGGWGWLLPVLRTGALLALVFSLLRPVLLRPRGERERGAVVVLADVSRSMAVVDNARTPAQRVALADGLGRLPQGVRAAAGAELERMARRLHPLLEEAAAAHDDLSFARASGIGAESARRRAETSLMRLTAAAARAAAIAEGISDAPALSVAFAALREFPPAEEAGPWASAVHARITAAADEAARYQTAADERLYQSDETVRAICDQLAALPRIALAEEALLGGDQSMLDALRSGSAVYLFAAGDELSPISVSRTGEAGKTLGVKPNGRRSRIASSITDALAQVSDRNVRAVVLLSDGRSVGEEGPVTGGLTAAGPPVFAVGVAPPGAARDLSFGAISFRPAIFAGEGVRIAVQVRAQGMQDVATTLRLRAGEIELTQPLTVTGPDMTAEFSLQPPAPGPQQLSFHIDPVPGEASEANNSVDRWLKVLPEKVRVAAFAGAPTWDFQYLRNALRRSGIFNIESGVLPPGENVRLPMTAPQILEQDVLILSDVPVAALDAEQWEAVYNMVGRGGSVILIAGDEHLPAEYLGHRLASNLLPFQRSYEPSWQLWPGEQPSFRFMPTQYGSAYDALRLEARADGTAALAGGWQQLPGFYRFLPIPVSQLRVNAHPLLVEVESRAAAAGEADRSSEMAVLTDMRIDLGRVLFFGAQESWRWRQKVGDRDHSRFWVRLVRDAAGEPYAVRSGPLALDLDRVSAEPGAVVTARARIFDDDADPKNYRIEVLREGETLFSLPLTSDSAGAPNSRAGPFWVPLPGLAEGDYQVRLTGPPLEAPPAEGQSAKGQPAEVSTSLRIVASHEAELADVSGDEMVLRRLAEVSGGEFFTLEEVGGLPERLASLTEDRQKFVQHPLWHSPLLFVFVVGCLSAEWALRKRVGLA